MVERGRGDWPTLIVAGACGAAFLCGLFVSWAVFAEPARAETREAKPAEQSDLLARIETLEAAIETLKNPKKLEAVQIETSTVKADAIVARAVGIADDKGRERITLSALSGAPHIRMRREDETTALTIAESGGEIGIALYDILGKVRLELVAPKNGSSIVRLLDTKGKVRVGLIATPEDEAEIFRVDKFGNTKAFQ